MEVIWIPLLLKKRRRTNVSILVLKSLPQKKAKKKKTLKKTLKWEITFQGRYETQCCLLSSLIGLWFQRPNLLYLQDYKIKIKIIPDKYRENFFKNSEVIHIGNSSFQITRKHIFTSKQSEIIFFFCNHE